MKTFQSLTACGTLGRDPVVKAVGQAGRKVANFSIAVDASYFDQQGQEQKQTDWLNIQAWGELSEIAERELKKGSQVFVRGKVKTRTYEKDGQKHYLTDILADLILPAFERAPKNSAGAYQPPASGGGQGAASQHAREDELPF